MITIRRTTPPPMYMSALLSFSVALRADVLCRAPAGILRDGVFERVATVAALTRPPWPTRATDSSWLRQVCTTPQDADQSPRSVLRGAGEASNARGVAAGSCRGILREAECFGQFPGSFKVTVRLGWLNLRSDCLSRSPPCRRSSGVNVPRCRPCDDTSSPRRPSRTHSRIR